MKTFNPSYEIVVDAAVTPNNFHVHVILGKNSDLKIYFDDEDVGNFTKINLFNSDLVDYSDSSNALDQDHFKYLSGGEFKSVNFQGFDSTIKNRINYSLNGDYLDSDKLYLFWTLEY